MSRQRAAAESRWLAWLALAFATAAFTAALALRERANPWLLTALAAAVSAAAASRALGPRRARELTSLRAPEAALGLAVGAVLVAATHVVYPLASSLLPGLAERVAALYLAIEATPGPVGGLPIVVVVVGVEELVWRGLAYELLDGLSAWLCVLASAGLYALPHLFGSPVLLVAALALGSLLGVLRLATGRLWAPALAHAVWSAAVFGVLPLH